MASPMESPEKLLLAKDAEEADGDSSSELLELGAPEATSLARGLQGGPRVPSLRRAAALLGSMALVGLLAGSLWDAEAPGQSRGNVELALGRSEFSLAAEEDLLVNSNDKHDGNPCAVDEEKNGLLCYKKCSLLTNSEYPIRTSAFTCCKSKPCTLLNQKHDMGLCSGFSVAGDTAGQGACPHVPGACLTNEEEHVGQCYKKCSVLTSGLFPYRSGPDTCCKYDKALACFPFTGHTRSSFSFSVGGGAGDGDKETPSVVHPPLQELTEEVPTAAPGAAVAGAGTAATANPTEQLTAEASSEPQPLPDWAMGIIDEPTVRKEMAESADDREADGYAAPVRFAKEGPSMDALLLSQAAAGRHAASASAERYSGLTA